MFMLLLMAVSATLSTSFDMPDDTVNHCFVKVEVEISVRDVYDPHVDGPAC